MCDRVRVRVLKALGALTLLVWAKGALASTIELAGSMLPWG